MVGREVGIVIGLLFDNFSREEVIDAKGLLIG